MWQIVQLMLSLLFSLWVLDFLPLFSGYSSFSALPVLSHWAFAGHLIKNGLFVVTEQESESHWQANWTVIVQL